MSCLRSRESSSFHAPGFSPARENFRFWHEEAGAWESRWRRSCAAPGGFFLPPASIPAMRWEWRRGSGREGCGRHVRLPAHEACPARQRAVPADAEAPSSRGEGPFRKECLPPGSNRFWDACRRFRRRSARPFSSDKRSSPSESASSLPTGYTPGGKPIQPVSGGGEPPS